MKYIWNKSNQIFQKKTHFSHRPLAEASIIKCLFVFVCDICFAFCMSTTFLFVQSFSYFCMSATHRGNNNKVFICICLWFVSLFACRTLFCLCKSFLFLHVDHSPRPQPPSWRAWDASSFCAGTRWKVERTFFRFFLLHFTIKRASMFAAICAIGSKWWGDMTWEKDKEKDKTRLRRLLLFCGSSMTN